MNEKFNKNAKVEKFTTMLGIAVRLIVTDPFSREFNFNWVRDFPEIAKKNPQRKINPALRLHWESLK